MAEPAPNAALLGSLAHLVRGLSALFWGLPVALVVAVQTGKGEWLRYGFIPSLLALGLLLYGTQLLGCFQKQERVWMNAVERARLIAIVNVGLSPFLFFWSKVSANLFFTIMVQLLVITTLLFVLTLNYLLARLAAMLPDETLRGEAKLFTRVNQTILLIIIPTLPFYFAVRAASKLPRFIVDVLLYLERGGTFIEIFLLLSFVLLPVAMTMALLWKTKEVILAGVFSSLNGEHSHP